MHDIIIVGAGTAGCVLADRLSASGRDRVLLIEAGGKPNGFFVKMPAGFSKLFKSRFDWAYESEPQTAAGGRRVFTPRGKMLGGSSNMNAQIHQWCHPADFDGWVADGATGWSWNDVAPVFAAQEKTMAIAASSSINPLSHAFVAAARTHCLQTCDNYNGAAYEGAWLTQLAHSKGRRFSVYDAFLKPAMSRRNLHVVTNAHVVRVLIEDNRAVGVVVRWNGVEQIWRAAKGVVLAAGAFGSPQTLLLSGIGPSEQLQQFCIPVVRESPEVGANLQDHPLVGVSFRTPRTDTFKIAESLPNLLRYLLLRRGMLTSNTAEAIAFAKTHPDLSAPDLELIFVPTEWRDQGLSLPQVHAFGIAAVAVAPKSRGELRLKSADPLAAPAIDFGLLTDDADTQILLYGLRLARRIADTQPLAAEKLDELEPGESVQSDTQLREWINTRLQTVYHPSSTCRMGSDPNSVVDPKLRVRGIENLWVCDASVMPSVPRGHPNSVVAMIAQRASEWL